MPLEHASVFAEEEKARKVGILATEIGRVRMGSVGESMWSYPQKFYRFAVDEGKLGLAVVKEVLPQMKLLWTGLKRVAESSVLSGQRIWKKLLAESQMNYVVVRETFQHAADHNFDEGAIPPIRKASKRDGQGFGNSAVQEHVFLQEIDYVRSFFTSSRSEAT